MNYMEKIAEMLGVGMGEKFKIRFENGYVSYGVYMFTSNGIREPDTVDKADDLLQRLLTGKIEIFKLPWKPKYWDDVWSVNTSGTPYEFTFNNSSNTHLALYKLDKLYHTREEAEAHAEEDKAYWNEIRKELEE